MQKPQKKHKSAQSSKKIKNAKKTESYTIKDSLKKKNKTLTESRTSDADLLISKVLSEKDIKNKPWLDNYLKKKEQYYKDIEHLIKNSSQQKSIYKPVKKTASENKINLAKRINAFIIDILILEIFVYSSFNNIYSAILSNLDIRSIKDIFNMNYASITFSAPNLSHSITLLTIIMSLLSFSYFVLTEYLFSASIGKQLLKLRIEQTNYRKKQISLYESILRNLWLIPIFPFSIIWIIDLAFILLRKDRKRFSDIISRTKVVISE